MSKEDIEKAQKMPSSTLMKMKKCRSYRWSHLEQAIYQCEKMHDEFKDKISDEDKETIKKAVEEAKEVLKDTNAEASNMKKLLKN